MNFVNIKLDPMVPTPIGQKSNLTLNDLGLTVTKITFELLFELQ